MNRGLIQFVGALAVAALLVLALQLVQSSNTGAIVGEPHPSTSSIDTGTVDSTAAPGQASDTSAVPSGPIGAAAEPRWVVLRYDGTTGAGTFEAVVCNPSATSSASGVSVTIRGPAHSVELGLSEPLPPEVCKGVFDVAVDFAAYGIAAAGEQEIEVTVADGDGASTEVFQVVIDELTVTPDPADFATYQDCEAGQWEDSCADYVRYQPVPGEVMKRHGYIQSIAPAEIEDLATLNLFGQANCYPAVEAYLDVTGPRPVSHRHVVGSHVGAYAAGGYSWTTSGPLEGYLEDLDRLPEWWPTVERGHCNSVMAHELTHLVLGQVPMPGYLNEGLATWMETTERSNSERDVLNAECGEDAWYGWDWGLEAQAWVPFSDLDDPDPGKPGIYHYYTGMCFWEYLDNTYGTEAVREIVRATRSHQDDRYNGCSAFVESVLFIPDIVNPIVGEDVSPVTRARWGFDATFTGCEGLY